MKNFVLFFLIPVFLYSAELIPQKLILTISDKTPTYKMEVLLQKAVLLRAKDRKDIYIFSDDNTELSGYGLSQVNAKILLQIKEEKQKLTFELFDISKDTNRIEFSSVIEKENFLRNIDRISTQILDLLLKSYPPKEKQKLVTVETEKKKLSEYEKDKPTFTLGFYFNLDSLRVYDSEFSLDNSTYLEENLPSKLTFSPLLNFEFEYMWFLLVTRAKMSISGDYNYQFGVTPMFGFFDNLFFVGIDLSFSGGRISGFEITDEGKNINFPESYYSFMTIGFALRFNITRDYYFGLAFGIFRPYSDYNFNYSSNFNIPFDSSDGPPFMSMDFNFKGFDRFIFSVAFAFYSAGIHREFSDSKYLPPVALGIVDGATFYLRRISVEDSVMGIGIKYEF
ncbi:MAG: hypothetical protein N2258_07330 [Brevinematales bacterium]|nr:hypothetical protein [Brevinematales bacterium]